MSVRTFVKKGSGGGGSGNVAWGPSFGNGDEDLGINVAVTITDLGLENTKSVGVTSSIADISLYNTQTVGAHLAIDDLAVDYGVVRSVGVHASFDDLALENTKTTGVAVSLTDLALENTKTAGVHLSGTVVGAPFWQSEGHVAASGLGGSSVVIPTPAGVVTGDLLLAFVGVSAVVATPADINTPSGWTLVRHDTATGAAETHHVRSFWKFAGVLTTPDSATSPHTATVSGSVLPTLVVSSWSGYGNALSFDGVNRGYTNSQGVDCGNSVSGVPGVSGVGAAAAFCLEAKINPTVVNVTQVIAGRLAGASAGQVGGLLNLDTTGHLVGTVRDNGGTYRQLVSAGTLTAAQHEVAVTYDGTTLRLYIDRVLDANTLALSGMEAPDATTKFWIGRDDEPGGGSAPYPFNGIIDEVRWSKTARYTGASYADPGGPFTADANTLGLWHFDSTATGPEPASTAFTLTASAAEFVGEMHRVIGIDPTTPINASAGATGVLGIANPADPPVPAVTTTVANCLVFAYLYHDHLVLSQSHTPPAGHIEHTDFQTTTAVLYGSTDATKVYPAIGATSPAISFDCTETANTDFVVQRVAVAPGTLVIAP